MASIPSNSINEFENKEPTDKPSVIGFAVVFNTSGVPIYAESGFIGKSVLPGGQAEITVGDFTFNGEYSYILVTVGVNEG
jgi:hypothetical protein